MRTVLVIGIGAGDPDHVTVQAVKAMSTVDAFLVLDKGEATSELTDLREEVLRRHVTRPHRVLRGVDPPRARVRDGYPDAVADWRRRRAEETARLLRQLGEQEVGAFLVWGDPSLFDSTLAILDEVQAGGLALDVRVVPGITSVSALCAQHRIPLNRVGRPVQITTGRRLADGWPEGVDDLVVMLDADGAYAAYAQRQDIDIHWGAYVGTPDEVLVSGRLRDVAEQVRAVHAEARARKGWIMDTYVLRRR